MKFLWLLEMVKGNEFVYFKSLGENPEYTYNVYEARTFSTKEEAEKYNNGLYTATEHGFG